MKKRDIIAGFITVGLSGFLILEGVELGLGRPANPGSGFAFWWIGWALGLAGAGLVAAGLFGRADPADAGPGGKGAWRLPAGCVASLSLYAVALQPVGFVLASWALLGGLFAVVGRYSAMASALAGLGAALLAWGLFAGLLGSPLPQGLLGGLLPGGR